MRLQLGAYNEGRPGTRSVPGISGYFALPGEEGGAAGVAYGRWFDADSGLDEPSRLSMLTLVRPDSLCGGQVYWANSSIADATYLGPGWRSEFAALDDELRRSAPARAVPLMLAPEIALPFAIGPSGEDFSRHYPPAALAQSQEGRVVLSCLVLQDHSLRCGVLESAPTEYAGGFAKAALRIFQNSRVRVATQTANGQASAGLCMRRAVSFRLG